MKKLLPIFIAVFLTASMFLPWQAIAQVPQKISYQAVIRNTDNNLVTNQPVGMRISILQGSTTGAEVYKEIYNPNPETNANGLVTIEIGSGIPMTGQFSAIDWSDGPYFLKIETDPTGGTNYTITGTSQILSVPYALHAKTAESISGGFSHYVGELYGGGIIVAVWKEDGVEKGLIASLTDISTESVYSNLAEEINSSSAKSPINGYSNSNSIITQTGHVISAAQLCKNYDGGGFNDWYLPAVWELNLSLTSLFIINTILGEDAGFKYNEFDFYWSSTEHERGGHWAYAICFCYFGSKIIDPEKTSLRRVRAFRRF